MVENNVNCRARAKVGGEGWEPKKKDAGEGKPP